MRTCSCSPWDRTESDTSQRLHFPFSLSCIGEVNGNPLQCSCLENPRDGGAWWAAVSGVAQSRTRLKRLSSSGSFVIAFLPSSKHLLISGLQSPSAVILEPKKIKSFTVSIVSQSICHELMRPAEKAMAPHSSTLTWKIPCTEKPGRLQSMGR